MASQELFPAFSQNNIPVVLSSNNLYVPYAGVFIQSLIDHANSENNYDIIILERNISESNKHLLKTLEAGYSNVSIRFKDPSAYFHNVDHAIMAQKRLPLEAFFKILAPFILNHYPKLVVVDVDTLLKHDIANLHAADLESYCIGAVPDVVMQGYYSNAVVLGRKKVNMRDYFFHTLLMKDPLVYVNSGVLVFDTERYRREVDVETILRTAQESQFITADQCVLNFLMEGKIKFLDIAWNTYLPVNPYVRDALERAPEAGRKAYAQASCQPYLLHWAAKPKPWVCPDVDRGYEWWQVAMRTPFVGHTVVRMMDALEARKEYYAERYGKKVDVWDPEPFGVQRGKDRA